MSARQTGVLAGLIMLSMASVAFASSGTPITQGLTTLKGMGLEVVVFLCIIGFYFAGQSFYQHEFATGIKQAGATVLLGGIAIFAPTILGSMGLAEGAMLLPPLP